MWAKRWALVWRPLPRADGAPHQLILMPSVLAHLWEYGFNRFVNNQYGTGSRVTCVFGGKASDVMTAFRASLHNL
jgi:hypothetical protein